MLTMLPWYWYAPLIIWVAFYIWNRLCCLRSEKMPQLGSRKRCCIVTGAASGIGLATAKLLLDRGWHVGGFDIRGAFEELESYAANSPGKLTCVKVDVRDSNQCTKAIAEFLQASSGHLDVLFNSAGVLATGRFSSIDPEKHDTIIGVNCHGVAHMIQKSTPALKATAKGTGGEAVIVSMASLSAAAGIPNHAVYAATKAFVYSLTESLRTELFEEGIRVHDVSVNYVDTPMVRSQNKKHFSAAQTRDIAQKIHPSEVASVVWNCIQHGGYYDEHHYVGTAGFIFASLNLLRGSGFFSGFNVHARIIDAQGGR